MRASTIKYPSLLSLFGGFFISIFIQYTFTMPYLTESVTRKGSLESFLVLVGLAIALYQSF